jgi:hypothetical protein
MELFTILVWGTVIFIMFMAKLKALQDVLVALILLLLMAIWNADALFQNFRLYKVYVVLKASLKKDLCGPGLIAFGCLVLHGFWPDAWLPGVLLHLSGLAAWTVCRVQTNPMVSCGLWAARRNQLTTNQLLLRVVAQLTGATLAFAIFGLYYSFRFPGVGPFAHIVSIESLVSALVTFGGSVAHIRKQTQAYDHNLARRINESSEKHE